jgi:hypothetical protein
MALANQTTPSEILTITRRFGWDFMGNISVTIECDPLLPTSIKLGLAVRAALKSGADLRGADLRGADLRGADLRGANLRSANLGGANLGGADLGSADLGSANLGGANLGSANLGSADLGSADLRGANLRGANLRSANLGGANLGSADLGSADLGSADLGGANLRSADLGGAMVRGAMVRGEAVKRLFVTVDRFNDAYTFHAFELEAGGVKVLAGCQWRTVASYKDHVSEEYPTRTKGQETRDILAFITSRAKALGITLTAPKAKTVKAAV